MKEKKRNRKLVVQLIEIALGATVIAAILLTFVASELIDHAYRNMTEEELKATAELLADTYNYAYEGDWVHDNASDTLYKGEHVMTGNHELLDDLKTRTGLDFTLFYMDTRVLCTMKDDSGQRNIGTKAATEIVQDVVNGGHEHYAQDITVGGTLYDIYYIPMYNSDKSCQGMVSTARESANVSHAIRRAVFIMVGIAAAIVVIVLVVGIYLARKTSKVMNDLTNELTQLAEGNLKLKVEESALARKDELGDMAESVQDIDEKLVEVIRNTQKMSGDLHKSGSELSESASQASEASSQVTEAIGEISKGAVSQAESIQTAAMDTDNIGMSIDDITENVQQLDGYASEMKDSCDKAMTALKQLIVHSGQVRDSVQAIGDTINSTNESAKSISGFTEAITSIASQTNLLSLNASIEAARAGEAGKGFSVVATEIGQLAEQSSESAEKIKKIVEQLVADAENSVEVLQKLNESFETQESFLDSTKSDMESMSVNVQHVSDGTNNITGRLEQLNAAKISLGEIISDLSAISEENAAATEQTNASMEELNATFSIITDSAARLQEIAEEMQKTVSYFKN